MLELQNSIYSILHNDEAFKIQTAQVKFTVDLKLDLFSEPVLIGK